MKTLRRSAIWAAFIFFLSFASMVYGQNSQSYLNDTGSTAYGINIPVENGFINISNGDLHLEFPFANHPQRGALKLNERLVYDSRIWNFLPFGTHGSYHWWPYNVYGASQTSGGWRFISGNEVGQVSYDSLSYSTYDCDGNGTNAWNETSSINWTDPGGTLHTFYASLSASDNPCANQYTQTITAGAASDGSGYTIHDDGNGNPVVVDNNGTQVYPQVIDRYGNYWSADGQGNLIDDTGRVPVVITQNGNTTYYDVLAPNGTPQNDGTKRIRYTVTIGQVYVSTQFLPHDQSDIYPFTSPGVISPVQSITLPDGVSKYSFAYDSYGELTQVTLPTGGTIQYGYENFLDSSQTENRWLTSRQTNDDPSTVTTYKPKTITQCANYSTGCQERIALVTPDLNETLYTLTLNNGAWNTATTSYQGILGANYPLVQTTNDNVYTNSCNNALQCSGANFLSQSFSTTTIYAAGQSQGSVSSQTITSYNPTNGKISDVAEGQNLVRLLSSGLQQGATRETQYTYVGNDLTQLSVYDSNGQLAGQTNYMYTSSAQPTFGLPQHGTTNAGGPYLSSESHWLSGGTSPITSYVLDDAGQMVSVIDPANDPKSAITYQCAGSLPLTISNSLSQSTQYSYDCASGALLSVQDPNDLAAQPARAGTAYQYEPVMGRLQSISYPDGGNTNFSYPTINEIDTTAVAVPNPSIHLVSISDNLGRPYRAIISGAEVDTTYDSTGRLSCTTLPFSVGTTATGSTCVTQYDGLNRPLSELQADGTSRNWSYGANTVSATDESGNTTTYTKDILGNLTTVLEPTGFITTYSYTGLGKISTITQLGNQSPIGRLPVSPHYSSSFIPDAPRTRFFTYDSLARPVSESQPESGTICYGIIGSGGCVEDYDPNGNLRHKTDARGVVTSYVYDALNRLTLKSYSDGTVAQHYSYDGLDESGNPVTQPHPNTIGRLTHTSNQINVAATYGYDAMGRTTIKSECTPQSCYHTQSAQYDLTGRMTSMTYPDGRTVSMSGDSSGRVTSVDYTSWGATAMNSNYLAVNPNGYDAAGNLKSATLGNGVGVTSDYDSRLRIKDLSYQSVNGPLWSKQFAWTGNGNLQTQTDQITQTQRQFGYDSLNRLTSAVDVIGGTSSGSAPTNTAAAPTSTVANSLAGGGADLSSWVATNASITPTSIQAPDGTATAALITANNGSPDSWVVRPLSNPSLYDQQSVTFSVWLRSPTGPQTVSLFIVEVGDDGFAVPAGKPVTLTSAWQSFQVTANTQNGLTTLICQIGGAGSFTSNQAVQVWGPQLVPSPGNVPSVTNSLLYSQRFTAPGWGSYYASVTDNADTAPDGTNTAALVVANPNSVDSYITAAIPNPIPQANTPVTASVYLRVTSGTQNLKLFLVGTGSGYSIPGSTVANLTTSWQRFTVSDSNSDPLGVLSFQIGGGNTLTNGQSIEVWGAQMELSPVAGQYVATAGAPVTQGSNLTNILPYSQKMDTWVAPNAGVAVVPNSVQAPDGSNTGATLTGSGSDSYMYGSVINPSLYSSASMTASVYLRVPSGTASVNVYLISIGDAGWSITSSIAANLTTNWQRFSLTGVTQNGLTQLSLQIGGGSSFTNGMVIQAWGGQMELASAAGPYVATDAIPVTSGKEYANILPNSTQLGGPNWGIANGSVVMNAVTAPDGSLTGASFTANAGSPDTYAINFNVTPALYDGETVTASVYLRVPSGTATMHVVLLDSSGSSYNSVATLNASLNTSWQRFDVTGTLDNGLQQLSMLIGSGGSFTSGTVDVWGPQIVQASSPGSYTPTPGSVQTANGSTASVAPGGLSQNFTYDSFGNIQQTGTVNFTAAYTPENRVSGFLYDAAGNMLSNGLSGMLVYNAENQVSQANGAVYTYDADGNRVETQGVTVTDTAYFNGMPIARHANGQWTDLIYGPTGLIAEVPGTQNGNPAYRMNDHLGTGVGALDSQGNVLSLADYAPFGQLISGGTNDPYVFTGLEADSESGLDHATFRQYAPSMGRWTSPDPYDGSVDLTNPQSLNRYNYVGNNPLGYTDPSGLAPEGGQPNPIGLGSGCIGAVESNGANPYADVGCGLQILMDIIDLWPSHPKLKGSQTPRPWDEHGGYVPHGMKDPIQLLNLPSAECEFGACGSSFAGPGMEDHHIFPQAFQEWFEQHGINIESYTIALTKAAHRLKPGGLHTKSGGNWNAAWKQWIQEHPNASPQEILNQGKKFLIEFGVGAGDVFSDFFIIVNPCVMNPNMPQCQMGYNLTVPIDLVTPQPVTAEGM